ncbi:hypothetical protein BKA62DRAFT_611709 [Auriculariales sp. MPI-PUGE-AT-0066]|nr:hypothetical protein BKA62DRAFT_611709 [Auriculariales sp. MPI-PUGE-AT-0066]
MESLSNRSSYESIATPPFYGSPTPSSASSASLASISTTDAESPDTIAALPWAEPFELTVKDEEPVSSLSLARRTILRTVSITSNKRDSLAPSLANANKKLSSRISMSSLMSWKRKRVDSSVSQDDNDDGLVSSAASVSSSSTISARTSGDSAGRSRSNSTGSQTSISTHDAVVTDPTACLPAATPIQTLSDSSLASLQNDKRTTDLLYTINLDQPSFASSAKTLPPRRVLDLGCGDGHWIYRAAQRWPTTEFVGMDGAQHWARTERLRERNELPFMQARVQFLAGDFLHDLKVLPAESFNHIRLGFLSLSLPKHAWRPLFAEIERVLAPGGTIEFIDEVPKFPTDEARFAADFGLLAAAPSDPANKALEDGFKTMLISQGRLSSEGDQIQNHFFDRARHCMARSFGETSVTPVAELEVQLPMMPYDTSLLVCQRTGGTDKDVKTVWAQEAQLSVRSGALEQQLHAARNMQLVLTHRKALMHFLEVEGCSRRAVEEALVEYENSQRRRLGFDTAADPVNDWDDLDDVASPIARKMLSGQVEVLDQSVLNARTVRLIRVYEARKPL